MLLLPHPYHGGSAGAGVRVSVGLGLVEEVIGVVTVVMDRLSFFQIFQISYQLRLSGNLSCRVRPPGLLLSLPLLRKEEAEEEEKERTMVLGGLR